MILLLSFTERAALLAGEPNRRHRTGDPELRDTDGSYRRHVLHDDRLHAARPLPPQDLRRDAHAIREDIRSVSNLFRSYWVRFFAVYINRSHSVVLRSA